MKKSTHLKKCQFVLLLFTLMNSHAYAQELPFNCDYNAYLFQYNDVYSIDLASGNSFLVAQDVTPGNINGAAYNPVDNFIWGSLSSPEKSIVRIGKGFEYTIFQIDELPTSNRYIGDISAAGIYYSKGGGTTYYSIDVNPASSNYGGFIATHQLSNSINIHDWAFNANDDYLYSVEKGSNRLYRIDASSGSIQNLGVVPILNGLNYTYGAVYFDADGRFYVSANQTGTIYVIQNVQQLTGTNTISSNIFAFGPASSQNDGARCPTAPVPQEDCNNGIDDDGDGLIDCEDPSCSGYGTCPEIESPSSSGNDGGLESNSRLANKITERHYKRLKNNIRFNRNKAPRVEKKSSYNTKTNAEVSLADLIPIDVINEDYLVESTPIDLLSITNATDIYSVDYVKDDVSIASVLAIKTDNRVYEHTKHICDRLLGAELLAVSTIEINDQSFIKSLIKNTDGTTEFVLSLSARLINSDENFAIESHWNLDRYTQDESYFNFQIWSNSIDDLYKLGQEVLTLLDTQKPISAYFNSQPPTVFVKKGSYLNGHLDLQIVNTNNTEQVHFSAGLRTTETSDFSTSTATIDVSNSYLTAVNLEVGHLFDIGFRIEDGLNTADDLFLSDGPWGIDDSAFTTTISSFTITNNQEQFSDEEYPVERNVSLTASTEEYVSLYRALTPRFQPVDLTNYSALKFKASGTGELEIRLLKSDIEEWEQQFVYNLNLLPISGEYIIPLSDFNSILGSELVPNNITTLIFTMKSNNGAVQTKQLDLSHVSFINREIDSNEIELKNGLNVYPNPVQISSRFVFESQRTEVVYITIYNQLGQLIDQISHNATVGRNEVLWNRKSLKSGLYIAKIISKSAHHKPLKVVLE